LPGQIRFDDLEETAKKQVRAICIYASSGPAARRGDIGEDDGILGGEAEESRESIVEEVIAVLRPLSRNPKHFV